MLPPSPSCFDLFCVQLDAFLLDLFWLHNPFSRYWGDKQTCSKHLNFARKLLDWLVPSAALRIFVAMILYELQLDAGAASKAIHHESLGCDSFFKPGGLWLRYHDLHLHHESSWIMMSSMYSTHTIPPKDSNTVSYYDARYLPDSTSYEVQFWDHCCHRCCTKFVPHRSNGDTLAFHSLGRRGCFWPRFVRDAYKRVGMKVGSSWGSTPVCEAIHGKFHHFPRNPC